MTEKLTYEELEERIQKLETVEYKFKRAEEALRETEGRYRAVVEDMPGLICNYLPGGEITFVNKAYCNYFGKTFEKLVGTNFLSLIPESERGAVMDNISALKFDSPTQAHEHRVIAPNGGPLDTSQSAWISQNASKSRRRYGKRETGPRSFWISQASCS
jgi:PAS domain S-box-containing protein